MVVHHQEQLPVAVGDLVDREDVRVRDTADDLDLSPEPLDDRRALAQVRIEQLERHLGAGLLVACARTTSAMAPRPTDASTR